MASQTDEDDQLFTCRACLVVDHSRTFSNLLEEPLNSIYFECTAVKVRRTLTILQLSTILSFQVHEEDVVSTVLCSLCVGRCDASKYFRDLAFKSDEKLKLKYGEQVAAAISTETDTIVYQEEEEEEIKGGAIEIQLPYVEEAEIEEDPDSLIETYEEIDDNELIVVSYDDELELEDPPVMSPEEEQAAVEQMYETEEIQTEEEQIEELQTDDLKPRAPRRPAKTPKIFTPPCGRPVIVSGSNRKLFHPLINLPPSRPFPVSSALNNSATEWPLCTTISMYTRGTSIIAINATRTLRILRRGEVTFAKWAVTVVKPAACSFPTRLCCGGTCRHI